MKKSRTREEILARKATRELGNIPNPPTRRISNRTMKLVKKTSAIKIGVQGYSHTKKYASKSTRIVSSSPSGRVKSAVQIRNQCLV